MKSSLRLYIRTYLKKHRKVSFVAKLGIDPHEQEDHSMQKWY